MDFQAGDYTGKPVREVFAEAEASRETAQQALKRAEQLYSLCAAQSLPMHERGMVLQQLWQVRRALGQVPLYMSQAGQDLHIHQHYFANRTDGLFVEIGAFDGLLGSNTYFFEHTLGWDGLVVEPCASWCERIRRVRNCTVVEAAIGAEDGEAEFLEVVQGYTQMSGLLDTYDEAAMARIREHPRHEERITRVAVRRLDSLLAEHGIDQVAYCSIDVEGGERTILETIDFDRIRIEVLSLENLSAQPQRGYEAVLKPLGFTLDTVIGRDEIFRAANDA